MCTRLDFCRFSILILMGNFVLILHPLLCFCLYSFPILMADFGLILHILMGSKPYEHVSVACFKVETNILV